MRYHFICLLIIFCKGIASAQDLTATQNIPANVAPGTDFTVEVTINKGTMTGFMKFFQEIPAGLTAAEIDSKTGSFTFSEGAAKIIWMAPPTEPVFTFSYKVSVPKDASGAKTMGGKISYIINNERKIVDLDPKTVMIGNAPAPVKTDAKTAPGTVKPVATKPAETKPAPVATEKPKSTPSPTASNPVKSESKPEAKQETKPAVNPNPIPVSSKVPVTAIPSASGKTYKVQIGAFSAKPKMEGVPEISTVVLENGITKYFSGNFNSYEEAAKRKKEMIDKGFQGSFIVSFENGKIAK